MKRYIKSSNESDYLIRIIDSNVDEDLISDFLRNKCSYISSLCPFIEISGPDSECDDVMYFLDDLQLFYRVF